MPCLKCRAKTAWLEGTIRISNWEVRQKDVFLTMNDLKMTYSFFSYRYPIWWEGSLTGGKG